MIFKTIEPTEENGLSSAKTVTFIQARKIAQDQLNASIAKEQAQLEKDIICLTNYENACKQGGYATVDFKKIMDGASESAKEYAVETRGATGSTEVFQAKQKESISVMKSSANATTGMSTALNTLKRSFLSMVAFTVIAEIIRGITTAVDNYIHRVEVANEAMDEAVSSYESTKSELESINSELETNQQKIDDLNSKDKLTYAEKGQLEELKEITKELETQQDIEERKLAKDQKESANKAVDAYNKQYGDYDISQNGINDKITASKASGITGVSRGENDISGNIAELQIFQSLLTDTEKKLKNTKGMTDDEVKSLETDFQDYIDIISDKEDSLTSSLEDLNEKKSAMEAEYKSAIEKRDKGELLSTDDKEIISTYESILNIINLIYQALDPDKWKDMQISNIFDTDGIEKSKDELLAMAKAGILDETTINGYKNLKASLDENGISAKDLCNELYALADAESNVPDITNKTDISSFSDVWNSADFSDAKDKLLELAKSGEISSETIKSTEEYRKLIDDTGLSAETAKNRITEMLSVQEKLSAASQGIEKLKSSYEEFKNIGFVTAQALESLPDAFKTLPDFNVFEKIVGNPESGKEKIQQAFNDIVKSYLLEQNTLSGLVNASNSEVQTYIANLKQMGITNAEEIVTQTQQALSEENQLINNAESEYEKAHLNYINGKAKMDADYLTQTASKNGQLASALGSAYKQDYDNWCELLSQKAEAYNEFVKAVGDSYDESKGITENVNAAMAAGQSAAYVNEQASKLVNAQIKANEAKNKVKLDLSQIKVNFKSNYSPSSGSTRSGGGSRGGSPKTKDTKQTVDWIERKLDVLQSKLDATKTKFDNLFNIKTPKNLSKNISNVTKRLESSKKTAEKYKTALSKIKLPDSIKKGIQKGKTVSTKGMSSTEKKNVKKYKDLWNKYNSANKKVSSYNSQLNNLKGQTGKYNNLQSQINQMQELSKAETKAISVYKKQASNVKLSKSLKKKVQSGDYKIENYSSDTQSLIQEYQGYIDKIKELENDKLTLKKDIKQAKIDQAQLYVDDTEAKIAKSQAYAELDAGNYKEQNKHLEYQKKQIKEQYKYQIKIANLNKDSVEVAKLKVECQQGLNELTQQEFDNIQNTYEQQLKMLSDSASYVNAQMNTIEEKGYVVNKSFYEKLSKNTESQLIKQQLELEALRKKRDEALKNGTLKKNTDAWYEMQDAIWGVKTSIEESEKALVEYNNQMRQLEWDAFDRQQDYTSYLTDESNFLIDLMSNKKLYDDNGNWTEYANATAGLRAQNYNTLMDQADDYEKEIKNISDELKNDQYNIDLISRKQELIQAQRDMIKSANDENDAIKSLVSDGYDKWLDALQKAIDLKKEELDSVSNLYEYEKKISELSKNVSTYEKQKLSLQGDSSEETKAKLQKINVELQNAKDALAESEYDRWKSDQSAMLDKLQSDAEEWINGRLDDIDGLLKGVIDSTNKNASNIKSTLENTASEVGTSLSDGMENIWSKNDSIFNVVSQYGNSNFSNTTLGKTLTDIRDYCKNISDNPYNGGSTDSVSDTDNGSSTSSGSLAGLPNSSVSNLIAQKQEQFNKNKKLEEVNNFLAKNLKKATHPKEKYAALNQYLYNNPKTKGKVLSKENEIRLAKILGVSLKTDLTGTEGAKELIKIRDALKKIGFSTGGTIGKAVKMSGEDGFILAKTGEEVLSLEKIKVLRDSLKALNPVISTVKTMIPTNVPVRNQNIGGNSIGDVEMNINLPNVTNYEDFKSNLIKDKQIEQFVQTVTFGNALGKNSLSKYKL